MSPSPLEGKHYDRSRRQYVADEEVSETGGKFTLLAPAVRMELKDLPTSPKGVAKRAYAMGWDINIWRTIGNVSPVLYLHDSDEGDTNQHRAGEVNFSGYVATWYAVEGRLGSSALGFQAFYLGKQYEGPQKDTLGSFVSAKVSDPAGLPVSLSFDYEPIPVTIGRLKGNVVETQASFDARVKASEAMAEGLRDTMNDGAHHWVTLHGYDKSTPFEEWLKLWATMAPITRKIA